MVYLDKHYAGTTEQDVLAAASFGKVTSGLLASGLLQHLTAASSLLSRLHNTLGQLFHLKTTGVVHHPTQHCDQHFGSLLPGCRGAAPELGFVEIAISKSPEACQARQAPALGI